jgi:hypothetical protein
MLQKAQTRPDLILLLSLLLIILIYPVLDHGDVQRLILAALMFLSVTLAIIRLPQSVLDRVIASIASTVRAHHQHDGRPDPTLNLQSPGSPEVPCCLYALTSGSGRSHQCSLRRYHSRVAGPAETSDRNASAGGRRIASVLFGRQDDISLEVCFWAITVFGKPYCGTCPRTRYLGS